MAFIGFRDRQEATTLKRWANVWAPNNEGRGPRPELRSILRTHIGLAKEKISSGRRIDDGFGNEIIVPGKGIAYLLESYEDEQERERLRHRLDQRNNFVELPVLNYSERELTPVEKFDAGLSLNDGRTKQRNDGEPITIGNTDGYDTFGKGVEIFFIFQNTFGKFFVLPIKEYRTLIATTTQEIQPGGTGQATNELGEQVEVRLGAAHSGEKISANKGIIYQERTTDNLILSADCETDPAAALDPLPDQVPINLAPGHLVTVSNPITITWTTAVPTILETFDVYFGTPSAMNMVRHHTESSGDTRFFSPGPLVPGDYAYKIVGYNSREEPRYSGYTRFTVA